MEAKKFIWFWAIFFLVLILASPLIEGGASYHTVVFLRLWIIGFGFGYLVSRIGPDRFLLTVPRLNWTLVIFIFLITSSLFITHYYFITLYWYSNFLVYVLLGYLCLGLFYGSEGKKLVSWVYVVLIAAGLVESLAGIFEYFRPHTGQISGTFFNPGFYAGYLSGLCGFPLALALFPVFAGLSRKKELLLRCSMGLVFCLFLLAVVLSASRSIIFAALPIGLLLGIRFKLKAVFGLMLLVIALVFIPNPLKNRLLHLERDPYAWDRLTVWKASLQMIRHHPLGVGLGMYQYYYSRYSYPMRVVKIGRYGKKAEFAHNDYLNLAAEASPLAPLLLLVFLAMVVLPSLGVLFRGDKRGRDWVMLSGFMGSLLALLGHALVDNNLRQPPIAVLGIVDVAAGLALVSGWSRSLVRQVGWPVQHPGFLKTFLVVCGALIAAIMTYQTLIFGLLMAAGRIQNPDNRMEYLLNLSRIPSGYASLYSQIGAGYQSLFQARNNPEYADKSLTYLELATQFNPENSSYYFRRADFLYRLGYNLKNDALLNQAEKLAQKSLELAPYYHTTYLLLANIAHLQKNFRKEEEWLKAGLEVEPYYFLVRVILIDFLIDEGRVEEARNELNLLKAQRQEIDDLQKNDPSYLGDYQLTMVALPDQELQRVEQKLLGNK